jgi:hypothetical protein
MGPRQRRDDIQRIADGSRYAGRMNSFAGILILVGIAIALLGVALLAASRLGIGRLPGDIAIEGDNLRIYVPVVSMIILSIVLTVVLNVALRIFR